jgi:hypothetical protein
MPITDIVKDAVSFESFKILKVIYTINPSLLCFERAAKEAMKCSGV